VERARQWRAVLDAGEGTKPPLMRKTDGANRYHGDRRDEIGSGRLPHGRPPCLLAMALKVYRLFGSHRERICRKCEMAERCLSQLARRDVS
jgi:hypothetical protein